LGARPLVVPAPVFIIGTYDKQDRPNAMCVAWGGICCSRPPCVAISVRPATHTHGNLLEHKAFTLNIPSRGQLKESDYFGIASGKQENKFAATGLTPVKSDRVHAPYVREFPLVLECQVILNLQIGSHTQFVGEIADVKAEAEVLDDKERVDLAKVDPLIFSPDQHAYYTAGPWLAEAFRVGLELKHPGGRS